ncbi:ROK family transcriptional regulator [Oceanivirga miroungae]|uniref:ROK family glucokinase n=1 Tax=Oceanivirga miroungae TaxID=1130046 RepID=A0A6I8M980_9FUSO|nr:ROK family transcriptional regulator [Oceanivirga miroungae]VWL84843.1 ROK family glucokinase [Oceanivirga miroungae]
MTENEYKVLDLILHNEDITSVELSEKLKVSKVAIFKILEKLEKNNYIEFRDEVKPVKIGRPRKLMAIKKNRNIIIGVNFGADFIEISVWNIDRSLIETNIRHNKSKINDSVLQLIIDGLDSILEKYKEYSVVAVGISLHGIVDSDKKISIFSPHFKWENYEIGQILEKRYKIPVMIDNDVRSMLNAEIKNGVAIGKKNLLYIYMKNGIGSSYMINGKIFEGDNNSAGEIGHYIVNYNSKYTCKCGKKGCLETEFSENSIKLIIQNEYEEKGLSYNPNINAKKIYDMALDGDEIIVDTVKKISYNFGIVIGNILNILDIENIVISGDILHAKNIFIDSFKLGIEKSLNKKFQQTYQVYETTFGDDAPKYGALSLVTNNLFANLKLIK